MKVKIGIASLLLAALAPSCANTIGSSDVAPTPQRPRISRNTQTTQVGTFEGEAGLHIDPNDFVDFNQTLKYGLTESVEYFMDFALFRYYDAPGDNESGIGDITLGLRHRFQESEDGGPSFAYEFFGKLPTGDDDDRVGTGGRDPRLPIFLTGSTDVRLAGIVEQMQGDISIVGYGAVQANGGGGFGGTVYQLLLASHASMPLSDDLSAFGEIVGTFTEGASSEFFAQGGVYQKLANNLVADLAVGLGLEADAPAFFVMAGVTTNLGALR